MKDRLAIFALMCILLTGILTTLLIPERYVLKMIDEERQSNYAFLGYDAARNTEGRAEQWFNTLFVKTGMMDASYRVTTTPEKEGHPDLDRVNELLDKGLAWTETRVRVIWAAAFQFMVRISVAVMWLPFILLILVPFIVDSLVSRKIKAASFAITSPHLQALGSRSLLWLMLGYLLLQMLPLKLHPVWTPAFIGVASGAIWLSISHFAKRA